MDKKTIVLQELIDYCAEKPEAQIAFPFGDVPICFKYRDRLFIEIYPNSDNYKITIRCDAIIGVYYRTEYALMVVAGYLVPLRQRRFKNSVLLDKGMDKKTLLGMIDHSYETLAAAGTEGSTR